MTIDPALADEQYCYLTTTGRVTGRPHTIEIWFALRDSTLYMLSGGGDRSDWVRNAWRSPEVRVRIDEHHFAGRARAVSAPDEESLARRLLFEKYEPGYDRDRTGWSRSALPVAVDLEEPADV